MAAPTAVTRRCTTRGANAAADPGQTAVINGVAAADVDHMMANQDFADRVYGEDDGRPYAADAEDVVSEDGSTHNPGSSFQLCDRDDAAAAAAQRRHSGSFRVTTDELKQMCEEYHATITDPDLCSTIKSKYKTFLREGNNKQQLKLHVCGAVEATSKVLSKRFCLLLPLLFLRYQHIYSDYCLRLPPWPETKVLTCRSALTYHLFPIMLMQ